MSILNGGAATFFKASLVPEKKYIGVTAAAQLDTAKAPMEGVFSHTNMVSSLVSMNVIYL